jgi:YD repeat-containing protein
VRYTQTLTSMTVTPYIYDAAGRLIQISNTILSRFEYTLDGAGDRVTETVSTITTTHTYTASGVYTVSLTASGPDGSDTLTRTNYITVSSGIAYTTTHRVISCTYYKNFL